MSILKKSAVGLLSAFLLTLPVCNMSGVSAEAYVSATWPLDSTYQEITTYFDETRNYGNSSAHNAIDIPADYGSNIYAVCDGVCVSADWNDSYGYLIILWHEELNMYTFYAHCSSMAVYSGQNVSQGDVVGYVGSTGISDGNHLHFGVCDSLLGGTPDVNYYNPLTYFEYDNKDTGVNDIPDIECTCTEDYAGLYTTNGIDTYLNIRSGHSTDSAVIGKLLPDEQVRVIKSDGVWAHVEYKGTTGYCAMEYLKKKGEIKSGMTISDANVPQGTFNVGSAFSLKGVINSQLPITRVTGGIYKSDSISPVFVVEEYPFTLSYDLSGDFDRMVTFDRLDAGSYIYKVEVQDETGNTFTLISSAFYVGDNNNEKTGDVNSDGFVNVSDLVLLQKYLLNADVFTAEQYVNADINRDSAVDVFDMVEMRKKVTGNIV